MQPCATSHPPWKEQNFPVAGRGRKETPTAVARLGDLLRFLSEFIPRQSTCAHPPDAEMFSSPLQTCSANSACPTSLLSAVIHPQVINHQQHRKYLPRQKCENTSTPNGNRTEGFHFD